MPILTYEDALAFWHGRINYEQLGMPQDLRNLRLDRMRRLLELLGNPHLGLQIVHVTGTKGKGSTSALTAAILRAAGWKTGLFTSPHLVSVRDRVQVNGDAIPPAALTEAISRIEAAIATMGSEGEAVTFFEIITAAAFWYFAEQQVDLTVLEVGLGGRFDATNVCEPLVSVITSISFDHVAQLGTTLDAIAREKGGIIKPGRPVVSGAIAPEAQTEIRHIAAERQAPLFELRRDFAVESESGSLQENRWPRVRFRDAAVVTGWMELHLWGRHQADNAALAWQATRLVDATGMAVPELAVAAGLRKVHWPARLEVVTREPWVVLDCAHNDGSVAALVDWLNSAITADRRFLILALSKDKDLPYLVRQFAGYFHEVWLARVSSSNRGADPAVLAELWRQAGGGPAHLTDSPLAAWHEARKQAGPADLICIAGSVFLAGELSAVVRTQG